MSALDLAADTVELRIVLAPRAQQLENISVQVSRLERRRRAVATSVRAFQRRELAFSASSNAADFVRSRTLLSRANCPVSDFGDCYSVRGRPTRPRVYIDEAIAFGGVQDLATLDPRELHTIEVYGGGREIRVYTNWFMARSARSPMVLMPIGY